MARPKAGQAWVDRYLRDEMTASEIAAFEQALMDSPSMQQELETAMALREMLKHDAPSGQQASGSFLTGLRRPIPTGIAAAIALAVFSTLMYWKTSQEAAGLQEELARLNQPLSGILTVPVALMRSDGGRTPDVVVSRPAAGHGVLLDIELAPGSRGRGELAFSLSRADGEFILAWRGSPAADGKSRALIRSEQIPTGRLWLDIASSEGETLERRLLEFL
ncbi:MAG: hypothetical protein KJO33_05430 [Gammaproteobacteria bacterium]|nr:hypothetical protein [Gammaproteobacteria bacterium]